MSLHSHFGARTDDEWLGLLKRSIKEPEIDGVKFPGFPDESTQVLFTSHKWEGALDEAFTFFQIAKHACEVWGRPLGLQTRYLDYGVGWGRITRMFTKDLHPANIFGVDVTPEILGICQGLMPVGSYALCQPRGTLDYPAEHFDLVTAFSVFSHLSPDNAQHWIAQLHRVVKPGGLVVLTTLAPSFVEICRDVAAHPEASDWARDLAAVVARAYPDWKQQLARFPKDQMLYLPSGGGFTTMGTEDYGWAMVPKAWAVEHWGRWFDVVEYGDDRNLLAQAWLTLRRR